MSVQWRSVEELYQVDFRIFMSAARAFLHGDNPYARLSPEFSAGAFAYPPTALSWLCLLLPAGALGFYLWTAIELLGWCWLARKEHRSQLVLLCWPPIILHLYEGQSSLGLVLVCWAATRATVRGLFVGLALALALTKPQVALLPAVFILWQDRRSPTRLQLWLGLLLGTVLLALPPTLLRPTIWSEWLASLGAYRGRLLQLAPWQGPSVGLVILAGYLWYRSRRGGWQWWLSASLFPQTSFYFAVVLLPTLTPTRNYFTLLGLALATLLQGPITPLTLAWILAAHVLVAWFITGGPGPRWSRAQSAT